MIVWEPFELEAKSRTGKIARKLQALAARLDDLFESPGLTWWKQRTNTNRLSLDLHGHTVACATRIHLQNKYDFFKPKTHGLLGSTTKGQLIKITTAHPMGHIALSGASGSVCLSHCIFGRASVSESPPLWFIPGLSGMRVQVPSHCRVCTCGLHKYFRLRWRKCHEGLNNSDLNVECKTAVWTETTWAGKAAKAAPWL